MDLFEPIRRWKRYREVRDGLSGMHDRTLNDIGINREEIPAIARRASRH